MFLSRKLHPVTCFVWLHYSAFGEFYPVLLNSGPWIPMMLKLCYHLQGTKGLSKCLVLVFSELHLQFVCARLHVSSHLMTHHV